MLKIDFIKYPLPRRFRHHTSPNYYFSAGELKEVPANYPPLYKEIDWSEVFINGKPPTELDIGCGKGIFLLNRAYENKNQNVLGIEVRKPPVKWLKTIIEGERFENCGVIWYSIVNQLPFIESESIEKCYYLFPDPWPKRKHLRRRAFDVVLLEELCRVMKPEGLLFLATDMQQIDIYHQKILESFGKFQQISSELWKLPTTNKESFCIKNNIPVHRIIVKKT